MLQLLGGFCSLRFESFEFEKGLGTCDFLVSFAEGGNSASGQLQNKFGECYGKSIAAQLAYNSCRFTNPATAFSVEDAMKFVQTDLQTYSNNKNMLKSTTCNDSRTLYIYISIFHESFIRNKTFNNLMRLRESSDPNEVSTSVA